MGHVKSEQNPISVFEYFLLIFIILWSGGGFTYGLFSNWMILGLPFIGVIFLSKRFKFSGKDFFTISTFVLLFLAQCLHFQHSFIPVLRPFLEVLTCLLTAKMIINHFPVMYVNILKVICILSLVLWLFDITPMGHTMIIRLSNMLPELGWKNLKEVSSVADGVNSIYVYSTRDFFQGGLIRNSGPFWEPGRFTIFITIALAINLFFFNKKITEKTSLLLLITNITTFSTSGYVAMIVLIVLYTLSAKIKNQGKFVLIVILLALIPVLMRLDFMSDKVITQSSQVDVTYSRFGAMFYHWTQIRESPFIGYGPFLSSSIKELSVSPNGITDLMRYYGIPFSILLFFLLYRSSFLISPQTSFVTRLGIFLVLLILCFPQTITHSPFYYLLYFFGLSTNKNYSPRFFG